MTNEEVVANALIEIQQAGGRFSAAVFTMESNKQFYVQFAAFRGDSSLYGEAVDNKYLDADCELSEEQYDRLKEIGWKCTSSESNPSRSWPANDDPDRISIVTAVMRTFTDVYGLRPGERIAAMVTLERDELLKPSAEAKTKVAERRSAYASKLPVSHVDFIRYLRSTVADGVQVQRVSIGEIQADSGQLILCDPFDVREKFVAPLDFEISPGRFSIEVVKAKLQGWGERIAFVILNLGSGPIDSWVAAKCIGREYFSDSIPVGSGLITICDAVVANRLAGALSQFEEESPGGNYYDDVLCQDMPPESLWTEHRIYRQSDSSLVLVSSGLGDGNYGQYWGLNIEGTPEALLVDFQLFDSDGSIFRV